MNNDLISREALKKRLNEMFETFDVVLFDDIIATIDNAPTVENITIFCENADEKAIADMKEELQKVIDDLRPQGEWKQISPAKIYECNLCHKTVMTSDIEEYRFCHGCGADMRKGGAE